MKSVLLVFLCLILPGALHGQSKTTGKASTKGHCSPATTGDNNIYYFQYCGSDPQQEKKIVELLNKILANQDAAALNARLDELLSVASQPMQSQNNSGGVNVQQGTSGFNSPIINSPITVGDVQKKISETDMVSVVQFLRTAPVKSTVTITADQYSGAAPFPDDFYRALKDAGWPMKNAGVGSLMTFSPPGKKFRGAIVTVHGEPLAAGVPSPSPSDPLMYIGEVLGKYGIQHVLQRNMKQEDGLILIKFEGGFVATQ